MTDQKRQAHIAALIREREGYERSGKAERVKAVDAELRRLGHEAAPPVARAARRPHSHGHSSKRDRG